MPLSIGARLGPYEILSAIGAGGMGEVYKARDTRLGRDVAVKVLPAGFAADPDCRRRFEHEARAVAALDHPHICALYDVGSQDTVEFLVMAYLDGETLAARLRRGSLPLAQALEFGAQIADALAAAHHQHIVHRDLKPGNIMLVKVGAALHAKLLDFGLAKLREPAEPDVALSSIATQEPMTARGAVLGTVPYMAPEQLEGKETDARTDIFALGCVLYEMLTGRRAFIGNSEASVAAAILTSDPPSVSTLQPVTPPALDRLVRRCLAKDPEARYQAAADVAEELRGISQDTVATDGTRAATPRRRRRGVYWALAAGGVLLLVVLAGGAWVGLRSIPGLHLPGLSPTPAKLTDKDTIILADFDNKTGDPVFDDTLKQGLAVELEQSPFLALVSDQRVNETLKLMGRPVGDRLTPAVTREVCQRTGSTAMLAGSIVEIGRQYVIGLKAVTCTTGDLLAETQEQAGAKEAVLKALDAAAVTIRGKLGESLSSVQKYATPVEEATTPSLEALKAFSMGWNTQITKNLRDLRAALPFHKRAVELDPNFAAPYIAMAGLYWSVGEEGRGVENAGKAYDLREHVSERERLWIEVWYYALATGELEKAAQTCELWKQTYPRDSGPPNMLGIISTLLGNWVEALQECREELRLDPSGGPHYFNLGNAYRALNRLDEAEAVYTLAKERKVENELLLANRYQLAFLKGDAAQMTQWASAAMGKPGAEAGMLATQADTDGWYGRLKNARELTGRAMDSALYNDAKESAADYQAEAALREVESGNREQARTDADAAVKLAPNRDVRAIAALALARAGDTAGAETLAGELDKMLSRDTLVQRYWLPTIRAAVALERHDPNRAIELLKAPNAIELSEPSHRTIALCPAYLRGQAYLMLDDGNRAAGEFQKFIDHRGLVMNFPWGALARLGLARAYALQADTTKARAAYQDFLAIWKDADSDLPVLKAAKAEYARLQ